jgi:hypothetical protein
VRNVSAGGLLSASAFVSQPFFISQTAKSLTLAQVLRITNAEAQIIFRRIH